MKYLTNFLGYLAVATVFMVFIYWNHPPTVKQCKTIALIWLVALVLVGIMEVIQDKLLHKKPKKPRP